MEGHRTFDPETIFKTPVEIKLGQLFGVAPVVRRMMANGLKSPNVRLSKSPAATMVLRNTGNYESEIVEKGPSMNEISGCLFVTAWVNGQPIHWTLVELISPETVSRLSLTPKPHNERSWSVRLANDKEVRIEECVDIDVNMAGTFTRVGVMLMN